MLAGNQIDKSLSCLSKKKAAAPDSSLIYYMSSFCVMFNSGRNNFLAVWTTEKGRMMRETSPGQAPSTRACLVSQLTGTGLGSRHQWA